MRIHLIKTTLSGEKGIASQQDRFTATRARIIDAAQNMFIKEGYFATTMQIIMREANVSKGGMYHHFDSKEDMFAEIFSQVSKASITEAASHGTKGKTSLDVIYNSGVAWLKVMREPKVASILLEQGPLVLGWKRARAIEEKDSLKSLVIMFQKAQQAGEINIGSVTTVAKLFNALLAESAFIDIEFGDPSWPQIEHIIKLFLDGLVNTGT